MLRRIRRRMQLRNLDTLTTYLAYMRQHPEEAQTLFSDFLITVTNFFRDAESFAALERDVIPELFQDKTSDDQIRVWVAGCATGEEAYSLAIRLLEQAHRLNQPPSIQIFATDLSEDALRRVREGGTPNRFKLMSALSAWRHFL